MTLLSDSEDEQEVEDDQKQQGNHAESPKSVNHPSVISSSSLPASDVVRHAGHVSVRGQIRRVWRPRFLELLDNGLVKYYELASEENASTDVDVTKSATFKHQQTRHHQPDPKVSLWIHSARIIDVMTLRDIHVGLPHGTFGFCFHAERQAVQQNRTFNRDNHHCKDSSPERNEMERTTEAAVPPLHPMSADTENSACFNDDISPKNSVSVGKKKEKKNPTKRKRSIRNMHMIVNDVVGVATGNHHHLYSCQPEKIQSRDYLCAVATLEEAQMWVVALQWASSKGKKHRLRQMHIHENATSRYRDRFSSSDSIFSFSPRYPGEGSAKASPAKMSKSSSANSPLVGKSTDNLLWDYISKDETISPNKSNIIADRISTKHLQGAKGETHSGINIIDDKRNQIEKKKLWQEASSSKQRRTGKIVVAKVHHIALVRIHDFQLDFAFVVQYLLIEKISVQECTLNRTCKDFFSFLQQLCIELSNNCRFKNHLANKILQHMKKIRSIDLFHYGYPNATERDFSSTKAKVLNEKLIVEVNSMFQSYCVEADIINSQAMKAFLGLSLTNKEKIISAKRNSSTFFYHLLKGHDHTAVFAISTLPSLQDENINSTKTDNFVKKWLKQKDKLIQGIFIIQSSLLTLKATKSPIKNSGADGDIAIHRKNACNNSFWKIKILLFIVRYTAIFTRLASSVVLLSILAFLHLQNILSISIEIRIDVIILSWFVAALLGERYFQKTIDRIMEMFTTDYRILPLPSQTKGLKRQTAIKDSIVSNSSIIATKKSEKSVMENGKVRANSLSFDEINIVDEKLDDFSQKSIQVGISSNHASSFDDQFIHSYDIDGNDEQCKEDEYMIPELLSSPLPKKNSESNGATILHSCWSQPEDSIFRVRGENYLYDRIKIPSKKSAFPCIGVDLLLTDNPVRHIARHPFVFGGKLCEMNKECGNSTESSSMNGGIFLVNFLLPFANFVSYFKIPPIDEFPCEKLAECWKRFMKGDQQYRDARLKLLPIVIDGPWIVKAAVGSGTSPALLGKVIPLQYYFHDPELREKNTGTEKMIESPTRSRKVDSVEKKDASEKNIDHTTNNKKNPARQGGIYEVDVIITASSIAKGILNVVKGHTKKISIAFAFIIEGTCQEELPETVLCSFQIHSLHIENCPRLPEYNFDNNDDDVDGGGGDGEDDVDED